MHKHANFQEEQDYGNKPKSIIFSLKKGYQKATSYYVEIIKFGVSTHTRRVPEKAMVVILVGGIYDFKIFFLCLAVCN